MAANPGYRYRWNPWTKPPDDLHDLTNGEARRLEFARLKREREEKAKWGMCRMCGRKDSVGRKCIPCIRLMEYKGMAYDEGVAKAKYLPGTCQTVLQWRNQLAWNQELVKYKEVVKNIVEDDKDKR